jgi:hypothetical protein
MPIIEYIISMLRIYDEYTEALPRSMLIYSQFLLRRNKTEPWLNLD